MESSPPRPSRVQIECEYGFERKVGVFCLRVSVSVAECSEIAFVGLGEHTSVRSECCVFLS